ncbi:MAG: hypothetical protein AB7K04_12780 [Pseudorhodoplanes sp.]
MRRLPSAISLIISGMALYFALLWGVDAARILTSPIFGLDNATFARGVYDFARLFHLGPTGILISAATCGAAELAIASILVCHIVERVSGLWGGKADHETLEAALLMVVIATIAAALPAILEGSIGALRHHTLLLALAGVVAVLSVVERIYEREEKNRVSTLEAEALNPAAIVPIPVLRGTPGA